MPRPADRPAPPRDSGETGEPAVGAGSDASAAPSGSFPHKRLLGRFSVSSRLGSGGFARVYQAHDPDLEIDVAVKLLRPELAVDEPTVEKFRREASTAARLRHPNVITVLMVGRLEEPFDGAPPGTPYLVMDYLPTSLADRLAGGAALPPEEVARVGAEVARGLAFAHRAGIIHRDVKPENILFAADGRAVVTDFGIARAVAGSPTAASRQVLLGTPTYFSPEQARGLPLDVRSDQYALGVTLFRAATGVLPFPGEDWYDVMRQHVEAQPPRVRALAPQVPSALEAVISRCLAKRPEGRFATADELAVALERARGMRPSGAMTVAVPAPVRDRRRPWRRWAVVGAGAAVAAAVGAAVWQGRVGNGDSAGAPAAAQGATGSQTSELGAAGGFRNGMPSAGVIPPLGAAVDSGTASSAAAPTRADSVARRAADSARRAQRAALIPALAVSVPAEAEVYIDDARMGRGPVRRETIPVGRHLVRATVPSLPGCPSADTNVVVDLVPGARRTVRLDPVACGRLEFDVEPRPARFRLLPARGGPVREGFLPLPEPLLLPEGDYELTIEAGQCASYVDDRVPVVAGRTRTERARLLCQ